MLPTDLVYVIGTVYKIIIADRLIEKEKIEGTVNFQDRMIMIADELGLPQAQAEAIIHEVVHTYALKLGDTEDEQMVIRITTAVFDFFANNSELARRLIEMCDPDFRGWEDLEGEDEDGL